MIRWIGSVRNSSLTFSSYFSFFLFFFFLLETREFIMDKRHSILCDNLLFFNSFLKYTLDTKIDGQK